MTFGTPLTSNKRFTLEMYVAYLGRLWTSRLAGAPDFHVQEISITAFSILPETMALYQNTVTLHFIKQTLQASTSYQEEVFYLE